MILAELRPLFEKYGITPTKRFGQNFLIDQNHLRRVVEVAQVEPGDNILEVGPGAGSLTKMLSERGANVLAIEKDPYLLPLLSEVLTPFPNATVLQADALKQDLDTLLPAHFGIKSKVKVVANIPYNITSPLLVQFLEHMPPFVSITLMVQKEVAERLRAQPDTENYGALTLFAQFYARVTLAATVPKQSFLPPPKVDSAIVHLVPHTIPSVIVPSPEAFFTLTRAAFGQRRKTLSNALQTVFEKESLQKAFLQTGISGTRRGETLTASEFAQLACHLELQHIAEDLDLPNLKKLSVPNLKKLSLPTRTLVVGNFHNTPFSGKGILHADFEAREALPITVYNLAGTIIPSQIINERKGEVGENGKFRWKFDLEFLVNDLAPGKSTAYIASWEDSPPLVFPTLPENLPAILAVEAEG